MTDFYMKRNTELKWVNIKWLQLDSNLEPLSS